MMLRLPHTDEAASLSYMAWLAYPGANEAHRRDTFIKASEFYLFSCMEIAPRDMPRRLLGIKPNRAVKTIESAWSQIVHRRAASVYAWLRMLEQRRGVASATNQLGVEVEINGADTITKAAGMWSTMMSNRDVVARSVADEYGSDFRKRTWRPTLPVLPMTIAFCFSPESMAELTDRLVDGKNIDQDQFQLDGPFSMGLTQCITSPNWVRQCVGLVQYTTHYCDDDIIFPVF